MGDLILTYTINLTIRDYIFQKHRLIYTINLFTLFYSKVILTLTLKTIIQYGINILYYYDN